jgi:hypothetical protein
MLSSVLQTSDIVWLLANTLLFFIVTHFWKRLNDVIPIQLFGVGLFFYSVGCMNSCLLIARWFGVDEDKQGVFMFVSSVFFLFIHLWYYEALNKKGVW